MSAKRPADSPLKSALKSPDKPAKHSRFDIGSPVPGPATVPTRPDLPGDDCDVQELRTYVVKKLSEFSLSIHTLENSVMERANAQDKVTEEFQDKLNALEPLVPHANDLTVFTRIKNYTTEDVVDDNVKTVQKELDGLFTTQLEAFTAGVEAWVNTEVEASDD